MTSNFGMLVWFSPYAICVHLWLSVCIFLTFVAAEWGRDWQHYAWPEYKNLTVGLTVSTGLLPAPGRGSCHHHAEVVVRE